MRNTSNVHGGHALSRFLVAYLTLILGVLMLMHVLQPARDGAASSSRSPVHQDRQSTTEQAAAALRAG